MKRNYLKNGFTLIELLVVIAIIGILAAIVIASLGTAKAKGRDARRQSDLRQIQLALELYNDANSTYPLATASLAPTYIAAVPTDPSTSAAYPYASTDGTTASCAATPCAGYALKATMEAGGGSNISGTYPAPVGTCDATAANYCVSN
jgi:prepilin-type N-terminal cleavage/methylation domain-containing protein